MQAGFEPDSCFYFTHAEAIRNKDEIDLAVDPPPELVIDVDVPLSSFDKLAVFAAAGVREVWRFRDGNVSVFASDWAAIQAFRGVRCCPC